MNMGPNYNPFPNRKVLFGFFFSSAADFSYNLSDFLWDLNPHVKLGWKQTYG